MAKKYSTAIWKYLIVLTLLLSAMHDSYAQIAAMQTDRPGESENTSIVAKNYFQAENGFLAETGRSGDNRYQHPFILWKYGLNEKVELRLITDFSTEKENGENNTGIKPVTLGFKVNLWKQNGIVPTTSFIGHVAIPNIGSKAFQTDFIAPSFRFLMQHKLNSKISVAYNLGAEWDGNTPEPTYIYTLTEITAFTKKVNCFVEIYGFAPSSSRVNHNVDAGITYLVNKNLMIDLSGGLGLTNNAPKNYVSVGFSYRVNTAAVSHSGAHSTIHPIKTS